MVGLKMFSVASFSKVFWIGLGILFNALIVIAEYAVWPRSMKVAFACISIVFQTFSISSVRERILYGTVLDGSASQAHVGRLLEHAELGETNINKSKGKEASTGSMSNSRPGDQTEPGDPTENAASAAATPENMNEGETVQAPAGHRRSSGEIEAHRASYDFKQESKEQLPLYDTTPSKEKQSLNKIHPLLNGEDEDETRGSVELSLDTNYSLKDGVPVANGLQQVRSKNSARPGSSRSRPGTVFEDSLDGHTLVAQNSPPGSERIKSPPETNRSNGSESVSKFAASSPKSGVVFGPTSPNSALQMPLSRSSLQSTKSKVGWDAFGGASLSVKVESASHTVPASRESRSRKKKKSSVELEERIAEELRKEKAFEKILEDMKTNQLETPLAKAIRILERMHGILCDDEAASDCLNMVLDILGDTDSLHSVLKSLQDMTLTKDTVSWVQQTLATNVGFAKGKGARWGQLRNISKKIGLKQLLENNRRMKCHTVKFNFDHGRAEFFTLQPLAPKVMRERWEQSAREGRRLGTQELAKGESEERDRLVVRGWAHPALPPAQTAAAAEFLARHDPLAWDFDVLAFHELVGGHSLWFVGMLVLAYHDAPATFQIPPIKLAAFLAEAERTYSFDPEDPNIYHNALHGADVALTVCQFLENDRVADLLTSAQAFALLMAALMHDYRHPGLNNAYLMKSADTIALTYNDQSVLENFHAAESWRLMARPEHQLLASLPADAKGAFRKEFIKVILATDLAHAFEFIDKFNSAIHKEDGIAKSNPDSQVLLMQFAIKCADICHPAKPWALHEQWSDLITREFFAQGAREARAGLPVSPLCDQAKVDIPKSQCNFIDFLVRPCFEPFAQFCEVQEWMDNVEDNYRHWQGKGGQNNLPRRDSSQSLPRRGSTVAGRRRRSSSMRMASVSEKRESSGGLQSLKGMGRKGSVLFRRVSLKNGLSQKSAASVASSAADSDADDSKEPRPGAAKQPAGKGAGGDKEGALV